MERPASPEGKPEIFIALVGAVGTELERLIAVLTQSLKKIGYESSSIRLASLIRAIPKYKDLPTAFVDEYISEHMNAGDKFREATGRDDAVAILGVGKIKELRSEAGIPSGKPLPGRAYIIRSLKNPVEVESLRHIYGSSFYVIAAYAPLADRRTYLAKRIARSRSAFPIERHFPKVDELINRDQEEIGTTHGQNTRDSFHRADLFVDLVDQEKLTTAVDRFVELIFGNTFHTPTRHEYGMFHAHAAALRSAELGRQVGAAILTTNGDIVAVGCNEVPKALGGLYWCDDKPDNREFRLGVDSNEEQKRNVIAETLGILQRAGWFGPIQSAKSIDDLIKEALDPNKPVIPKDSKIRNLIEFGRAVHGEMASISDAARRGVSIQGCYMYVTTFPCHLCARHVVASGITKLLYIEPYAKSLAAELYPDSIAVDGGYRFKSQIPFVPFVGVAPRQYLNLFAKGKRKDDDGNVIAFTPDQAKLRFSEEPSIYLEKEVKSFKILSDIMMKKGLIE
jgi:deoxycytidylate deaminase